MFEHMEKWIGGLGSDEAAETIKALSKESVRDHKNKRLGSEDQSFDEPGYGACGHGHSSGAVHKPSAASHSGGYGGGGGGYAQGGAQEHSAYGGGRGGEGGYSRQEEGYQRQEEGYQRQEEGYQGQEGGYGRQEGSGRQQGYGGQEDYGEQETEGYSSRRHESAYGSQTRESDETYGVEDLAVTDEGESRRRYRRDDEY
jgi:hypothetical protein